MNEQYVLGIDIGGTKIALGLVDRSGQQVIGDRIPTEAEAPPAVTVQRMLDRAEELMEQAQIDKEALAAVGIAFAGPLDAAEGRITTPPNLPTWHNFPLVDVVRTALGKPTYLENDANAAAWGEAKYGAGVGVANMVYLTVSTGVGGGAVLDGRLYRGETGAACELGHIKVVYNGRECGCGGRGCLEAYASGTALAKRAQEAVAAGEPSSLAELAGSVEQIRAETVVQAMDAGDELASRLWNETMEYLSAGVGSLVNTFNPRLVVVGGGLTKAGEKLFEPLREGVRHTAMGPLAEVVEVVPAKLGDAVGVIGAAAVAWERLAEES